jgi:hypothetical protein
MQVGQPAAVMVAPDTEARLLCDDQLAETFTTPTLTSWACTAEDLEIDLALVTFTNSVTAGSPCRVQFLLRLSGGTLHDQMTRYSTPEQNYPHAVSCDITESGDRAITYDLYWQWTSGMQSSSYALVAEDVIYVPGPGEDTVNAEG